MNALYYRLYVTSYDDIACVVCMQDHDGFSHIVYQSPSRSPGGKSDGRYGYDQSRFLSDKKFDSEEHAWAYLLKNIGKLPPGVKVPLMSFPTNCLDGDK